MIVKKRFTSNEFEDVCNFVTAQKIIFLIDTKRSEPSQTSVINEYFGDLCRAKKPDRVFAARRLSAVFVGPRDQLQQLTQYCTCATAAAAAATPSGWHEIAVYRITAGKKKRSSSSSSSGATHAAAAFDAFASYVDYFFLILFFALYFAELAASVLGQESKKIRRPRPSFEALKKRMIFVIELAARSYTSPASSKSGNSRARRRAQAFQWCSSFRDAAHFNPFL
ncbi:unnamed protein product [Trichogramma brassicae]|uniref:Uncharacterized protein n=1 Tax=Trichogramma brassicae TaxID=86971 RepID=A0A6H5IHJ6_9HYME|nr:unnamed protein product [Trichogramma brassicae]